MCLLAFLVWICTEVSLLSIGNCTVSSSSPKTYFLSLLLASTAPPDECVWRCHGFTNKKIYRESFAQLDSLLDKYWCAICKKDSPRMKWTCAAVSENLDLHPGFLPFQTVLDIVVLHSAHVISTAVHVSEYELPNGTVLSDFYHTENGFLSDADMLKPGSVAFFITGISRHTKPYVRLLWDGAMREWNYPNHHYAFIRTHTYATILLLNPDQMINLNCGKLYLDIGVKEADEKQLRPTPSLWLKPFSTCWSQFVARNPHVTVECLYRTDHGIYYGSPTDSPDSYQLSGYRGLPLLLQYYRNRIAKLISTILVTGRMRLSDKEATVPPG